MNRIFRLTANMLAIATFALVSVSCEEEENPAAKDAGITSIALDTASFSLEVGSTFTLTATFAPDNNIDDSLTWSTYNKDIATVSATGKRTAVVTAVSTGTTIINVVTSNNKKTFCEVTVTKTVPLVAITITLPQNLIMRGDTLHLEPEEYLTLVATQGPAHATNYHPVWTSSNPEVVTVDGGVIDAIAPGKATVTVSSGTVSESLEVLVTDPLASITINPDDVTLSEIGNMLQLEVITTPPVTRNYNPVWNSSNNNIVTVSETGLLTAVGVGTAIVRIESGSESKKVTQTVTVKVTSAYLRDLDVPTEVTLRSGYTKQIEAKPLPETASGYVLTWTSSDESIVTVSQEGYVTGVSSGSATVTVSSGEVSRTITIFVDYIKFSKEGWTATAKGGNHPWYPDGGAVEYAGEPRCVIDGDFSTGWHSATAPYSDFPQVVVVDMKETKSLHHIVLWHVSGGPNGNGLDNGWIYYNNIRVYLSNRNIVLDEYNVSGDPVGDHHYTGGYNPVQIDLNPGSQGRYLILFFPDSYGQPYISFGEVEVYGAIED